MYNFSIFIDDCVAKTIENKIDVCRQLEICNMEINEELDGVSIAHFSGEQLNNLRNLLISTNRKIVLLNCIKPVTQTDHYKNVFRKAQLVRVENIKVTIKKEDSCSDAFIEGLQMVCKIGKAYGIKVLVENDSTTFLSTEQEISEVFKMLEGLNAGLIFNPLEFVRLKSHPFFHVFYNSRLKNNIFFLRVNDGLYLNGKPVLISKGNAEIKELASILIARGFTGYFSFVPYLEKMNVGNFAETMDSFKKLLMEM